MKKILVHSKHGVYPIFISYGLIHNPEIFWPSKNSDYAVLITDYNVASFHLSFFKKRLKKIGIKVDVIILPIGEENKSLIVFEKIFYKLCKKFYDRNVIIVSFGGGVIGDLSGFVASVYKRGVRLIHIPTTLLSQIDSSIGGKNAINFSMYKNIIGTFYNPISVISDIYLLQTLSKNNISSGISEIIKYAISFDKKFFTWLEENLKFLLKKDVDALFYCVKKCCILKKNIITLDEYEKSDKRILLNFGHTYGHAIESYMNYHKNWSHGKAISVGMVMATNLSKMLGKLNDDKVIDRLKDLLIRSQLPIVGPKNMKLDMYFRYMYQDKKNVFRRFRLIVLKKLGKVEVCSNISHKKIVNSIKNCCK